MTSHIYSNCTLRLLKHGVSIERVNMEAEWSDTGRTFLCMFCLKDDDATPN